MKTFLDYMSDANATDQEIAILQESLQTEWTDELEERVDAALEEFVSEYRNEDGTFDIDRFDGEITNEGMFGSIFGGLTGFALGKTIGKTISKVLGIQKGIFYEMLTSRLVGAALGAAIGKAL
tara:strand:- start:16 stop:384 length:369 start_codon:yes stop_codon:yes gene_type:complete